MMHRHGWSGPRAPSNTCFAWFVWDERSPQKCIVDWFDWKELRSSTLAQGPENDYIITKIGVGE